MPLHLTSRRALTILGLYLVAGLAGCATAPTGGATLVAPTAKADGTPGALFACQIAQGDDTNPVTRVDELRCDPVDGSFFNPDLQVLEAGGSLRNVPLGGDDVTRMFGDRYPLELRATQVLEEGHFFGIDFVELQMSLTVTDPDELAEARGPEAPFETWRVEIENRSMTGRVVLDPRTLALAEGSTFRVRGERSTELELAEESLYFRAGEVRRLLLPVTRGTESLTLSGGSSGAEQPFTLEGPGRLVITDDGLIAGGTFEVPTGADLVRCASTDAVRCALVVRDGVTLGEAIVTLGDETLPLPLDGTEATFSASAGAVDVSVQITGGIAGVPWDRMPPIDGQLVVDEGISAALELPFALARFDVTVSPDLDFANLDVAEPHPVPFTRAWADAFSTEGYLSLEMRAGQDAHWVAGAEDLDTLRGTLNVLGTNGAFISYPDTTLTVGPKQLTMDGLSDAAPPAETGDVIVSCHIGERQLECTRDMNIDIASATLEVYYDQIELEQYFDLDDEYFSTQGAGIGPLNLTLIVQTADGQELRAEGRYEMPGDLSAEAPLLIRLPE